MSEAPQETPIELLKLLVKLYDELDVNFPVSSEAFLVSNFDELFQQLKIKVDDINLLEAVCKNLPILTELQGLMLKLSQPEAPSSISIVVLDLEILLDQAIQTITFKRYSATYVG